MSEVEDLANEISSPDTNEDEFMLPEDLRALAAAAGTDGDRRRRHGKSRHRELRHKSVEVTAAIASVSIVYLIVGVVELRMTSSLTSGLITMLIGVLYGGLAYWARFSPFRAAATAVLFFAATLVIAIISDPRAAFHASNVVLVALAVALVLAHQHRKLKQRAATG